MQFCRINNKKHSHRKQLYTFDTIFLFLDQIEPVSMFRLLCTLFLSWFVVFTAPAANARYRCTWRDDPATTMVIGWDQVSGTNPVLYYDLTDHGQKSDLYKLSKKPEQILAAKGMNNHFVRLSGLKPNTVYYFVIKDSEGISKRYSFKTAPDHPKERISIIAGGDSRNFRDARRSANALVGKLRPHLVLFNGDMTADDSAAEWKKWLDDWQETIASDGRMFPVLVARGNHEASNQSLVEIFDVKALSIYYAFNIGGDLLRIYTLNTLIATGGEQKNWLENDLKNNAHISWKIAQYHHAIRPHTKAKAEKDELWANWANLFFKYAVKLLIESDSHVVKWTYPLRPSTGADSQEGFVRDDEEGSVYIGEGCWGAPLRDNDDDKEWTRNSGSFNQFAWIFVDQSKIEIRTVKTDGAENVSEVNPSNIFTAPMGLVTWSPPNGDVITIYHPKHKPIVAAKKETTPEGSASSKPTMTAALASKTKETRPEDEWAKYPKLQPDSENKVAVKYDLAKSTDVTILLLNNSMEVLSKLALPKQAGGSHLNKIDISDLKSGTYLVVVKTETTVIMRYRVIK